MSGFDDEIGDMVDDLLTEAGGAFTYRHVVTSQEETITARKSVLPSFQIDNGAGFLIEVRPADFIMKTAALPFGNPVKGQRIEDGSEVYEIWSVSGEKCFRQISPQMTRIHTKRIA